VIVLLYLVIFVVGAVIGSQLNRGIYRLAWSPRWIGPWSPPHPEAPPRRPIDRVPILGWIGLRREAAIHGAGYWVRPMLLELAAGVGLAALYWWEIQCLGLLPSKVPPPDPWILYGQYLVHVLLISLMTVATFIDFDEKTIPDAITLPGTLLFLMLAACLPAVALPVPAANPAGPPAVGNLLLSSPNAWPARLDGVPGLGIGLACLLGWCLAVWPKTVTMRRGLIKAGLYLTVSMFRYPFWRMIVGVLLLVAALITGVWFLGGSHWQSLLSALIGMAFGGGLIWAVRIVGGTALGKEAMGFGDVTLMAMIGAYVGWQPSLMIFFMAPFVAVVICLVQWIITHRRDIAFGPYLCAATLLLILYWSNIWNQRARPVFHLGWMIPQVLFFCLVLMGGLLSLWRIIESALFRHDR